MPRETDRPNQPLKGSWGALRGNTARICAAAWGLLLLTGGFSSAPVSRAADSAFQQGLRFYRQEDYKKAIMALEKAAAARPDHAEYRRWLGRAYGRRAETMSKWKFWAALELAKKTRLSFEQAVELDPSNPKALRDLFDFYLQAPPMVGGGLDRAEAVADRIRSLDEAAGQLAWAEMDEKRGKHAQAEARLRRAHRVDAANFESLLALASFLSRRGATAESDKLYKEAFRRRPESPKLWLSRAKALLRSGRGKAEAHGLLQRYLAADLPPDAAPRREARQWLQSKQIEP